MVGLGMPLGGREWEETFGKTTLSQQSEEFSFYQPQLFFRQWKTQKARSETPQRSWGEEYVTLKFKPVVSKSRRETPSFKQAKSLLPPRRGPNENHL